jgi:hypothetical protein
LIAHGRAPRGSTTADCPSNDALVQLVDGLGDGEAELLAAAAAHKVGLAAREAHPAAGCFSSQHDASKADLNSDDEYVELMAPRAHACNRPQEAGSNGDAVAADNGSSGSGGLGARVVGTCALLDCCRAAQPH